MTNYKHKVHYYETDKMGIVHHSNYAVWYEQARTEFIRHFGLSYGDMEKAGILKRTGKGKLHILDQEAIRQLAG